MIKKLEKLSADNRSGAELPIAVKDSAQQIWLAGLGAFSKAQEEGGKVFEALVREGVSLQRKSQADAEERLNEAAERISTLASNFSSKATGQWDRLETIFEERVSKALERLGMPTAVASKDLAQRVEQLTQRVEQLTQQVQALSSPGAGGARGAAANRRATPAAAASGAAAEPSAQAEAPAKPPARKSRAAAVARRKPA